MLPTQLLSALRNRVAHAFQVPALCQVRKGRGTHCVYGASEVKSLGHPPAAGTSLTLLVGERVWCFDKFSANSGEFLLQVFQRGQVEIFQERHTAEEHQ